MLLPSPVATPERVLGGLAGTGWPSRLARWALLAASDATALFVSAALAYLLWALPMREQSSGLYLPLAPLALLFVAGYAQAGLYPAFGLGPVETLRRLTYVTAFGFLVLAAFSFALKLPPLYSRVTFTIAFVLSLAIVPLSRVLILHAARRWSWWHEPVAVIGTGPRAARAIRSIQQADYLGYRPAGVLAVDPGHADEEIAGVSVLGGLEQAPAMAARGIRVALLETDHLQGRLVVDRLQRYFRHVVLLREFEDLPVEGLQVRNLGSVVGIEYTNNLLLHSNRVVKRALDLVLSCLALTFVTPVILLAALVVRLIDGAPAFFFQDRIGLDGRRVEVPKIRTMRLDAERRLEEHLAANPSVRHEWNERYKLKHDPRLIPVAGRLFRRFSLDELPQLWAVVTGDMSLVGPRPFPDYHIERFSPEFRELRHRVRPGITGLWQIMVRSEGGIDEQQAYDSYYIRNWSVWLDLYILSRTVAAVLSGRGAY
jgi:Undecaprenyl-phosphate galactose phosphotransferase WbaP